MVTQRPPRQEEQCLVPTRTHPPARGSENPTLRLPGLEPVSLSTNLLSGYQLSYAHGALPHAPDSSVGCMAGVFHLISSKYRTRRKFLTLGRKQTTSYSSPQPQQPAPKLPARKGRGKNCDRLIQVHTNADNVCDENSRQFPSLSCQIPRSPTIPPEIRKSNFLKSREIFRSPASSVVARLMGLEEAPPPAISMTPESAAEKRRKLLGALEKCDDDLQALRRIIEAARSTDRLETKKCKDQTSSIVDQGQPSLLD